MKLLKFHNVKQLISQNFFQYIARVILVLTLGIVFAYIYVTQLKTTKEVSVATTLPEIPPKDDVAYEPLPENTFTEIPDYLPPDPQETKKAKISEDERIALSTDDEVSEQREIIKEEISAPVEKPSSSSTIKDKIKNYDNEGELFIKDEIKPYNAFQKNGFLIQLGLTLELDDFQNNNVIAGGLNVESDSSQEIEAGMSINIAYQKSFKDSLSLLIGLEISPHIGQKGTLQNSLATTKIEKDYTVSTYLQPQLQITNKSAISVKYGLSRAVVDINGQSENYDGYVVGFGYRYQYQNDIYWFGEFNQYIYSEENTEAMVGGGLLQQDLDLDSKSINFGLGYQF